MSDLKNTHLCLVIIKSPQGDQARVFDHSPFVLGREQSSDIVVAHPSISRKHLIVHFSESGIQIQDSKTANGTYKDNSKIRPEEPVAVFPSEKIKLGQTNETYEFMIIPRPLEFANVDTQKKQLQGTLHFLLGGLKDFAKKEAHQEVQNELQRTKEIELSRITELKKSAEFEAIQKKQQLLQMAEAEVATKKLTLESELLSKKAQLESEIAAKEEFLRKDIFEKEARLNAELEEKNKQMQAELVKEYEFHRQQNVEHIEKEKNELQQKKDDLQKEIDLIKSQFDNFTQDAKIKAESKIQEWLRESQKRIQEDEEAFFQKQARLQKENTEKMNLELQDSQLKSDELIRRARDEAERIRDLAQSDSKEIRRKALEQADSHLLEAKSEAQNHIQKLIDQQQSKLDSERAALLENYKKEAQESQETIIRSYKDEIESLRNTQNQAKMALADIEKMSQTKKLELNETEDALKNIIPTLESKKTEFSEVLKKVDDAEVIIKRSILEKKNIDESLKKLKELDEEFKSKKEKLIIEHDDKKRDLEKDLSIITQQHQEALKKQIQEEERRIKDVRKTQAAEFARMIEVRLTDKVKGFIQDQQILGQFSQDLFTITREVLSNEESSLKPLTLHLDKDTSQAEEKNKKHLQTAGLALAFATIIGFMFFRNQIHDYYKAADQNSVAKQLIDQRRIQSIYNPEQNDTYRDSYMDNVLYYKHYVLVKNNPDYQKKWTLRLNDVSLIRELKITEDTMVRFQAIELNLVNRLAEMKTSVDAVYLSEGLETMRKYELEEKTRILDLLKNVTNYQKIRDIEKEFIEGYKGAHRDQYP